MTSVYFDRAVSDDERRRGLYAGDIFIQSPSRHSAELIELARGMVEEALNPYDPRTIHEHKSPEELAEMLAKVKPAFIHHPECKRIIPALLEEMGCDPNETYFDVPRLRTAYPKGHLNSGIAYAFHAHRDTWYSAPMCQVNWWTPIYPLSAENCMAFYPKYFDVPVANNSEVYNYYQWNEKNRASAAQHVRQDTREQPKAQERFDTTDIRLLPPPGGVILFSGAQFHATVENVSGIARYSIDFRVVHRGDAAARRGAPNVDSRCTGTTMRDYLRASDLSHLPEDVVAQYDDGTEVRASVLNFNQVVEQAAAS